MDKRYQVFVSSTYTDLKEERQLVMQTLMELDCIPAGMELFPAADEEQFEFIKRVIDDCDYYLIIIGGRYGSLTGDGISFTEKEYEYALSKDLKVIALVHARPGKISVENSETDTVILEKLEKFKEKVKLGRLVKFWEEKSEIPGIVALSVSKTIKLFPAVGWVRANQIASVEILEEINKLRKENEDFRKDSGVLKSKNLYFDGIADLDEEFEFSIAWTEQVRYETIQVNSRNFSVSWKNIFLLISPTLIAKNSSSEIIYLIGNHYFPHQNHSSVLNPRDADTIKIQFLAYGFIKVEARINSEESWCLTELGEQTMLMYRSVKSQKISLER